MMNFLKLCICLHNEVLFDVVAYFFDAMVYVLMLWCIFCIWPTFVVTAYLLMLWRTF